MNNLLDVPYILTQPEAILNFRIYLQKEIERLEYELDLLQKERCTHVNIVNYGDIRACPDCGWSGTFTYQEEQKLKERIKK